ncbi:hypothetical protein GLOIN_2v1787594 [Rhizophagus clarus]|uniref:Uncharacterized protein n=1 Tax=Rhizophagus clarus TaxID=94130 RepID=A0A8H3R3U3_9GLOM|nr:hypothetical protein GLOIN_2v1787594 [Rhizophagus clarus]
MKRLGIGAAKLYESLTSRKVKLILCHNATFLNELKGLLRRVFLWIYTEKGLIFKKFYQKNDQDGLEKSQFTFEIPFSSDIKGKVEPNADIHKRSTSIQSIFNAGNEEVETIAISGHNSSAGVCNYFKVTKEKKRIIFNSVIQRLTDNNDDEKQENNEIFSIFIIIYLRIRIFIDLNIL